jgi:hypothetical protein
VGVVIDKRGALLVADDVGNAVWRVTPAAAVGGAPAATTTGGAAPSTPERQQ